MGRLSFRAGCLGAVLAAALLWCAGVALADSTPLPPNLRTLRPGELQLNHRPNGHDVLRFSNSVVNRGAGPLELAPHGAIGGDDCHGDGSVDIDGDNVPDDNDQLVDQVIYADTNDSGAFDRDDAEVERQPAGCHYYHPAHHHWHYDDFAKYQLNPLAGGAPVTAARKISFCLVDTIHPAPALAGSPTDPYYTGSGCAEQLGVTGISVGWGDIYVYALPGQRLNVTGVPPGNYCLLSTADPDDKLLESDNGDNSRGVAVHLNPSAGKLRQLGPC